MILYHFMWDLVYIAGINIPWYSELPGKIWQKSICISFIFLSGFCFSFGKKRFRRSLEIFICGIVVSAVTFIAMPEEPVIFGVLTFIGSAGLITILFDKLHKKLENNAYSKKIYNTSLFIANILLFVVCFNINKGYLNFFVRKINMPQSMYSGYISTFFGFMMKGFISSDYFALLPWYFLYISGYFLYRVSGIEESKALGIDNSVIKRLKEGKLKAFRWLGQHSLLLYMLHQPVLYALTLLIIYIK